MKKFLSAIVILIGIGSGANAQLKLGVKYSQGFSIQDRNDGTGSTLISTDAFKSMQAGIVTDYSFSRHLSVQSQLLYSRKGAKFTNLHGDWTKVSMKYIEVPVNMVYWVHTGFGHMFIGAGPYAAVGVGGKSYRNEETKKLYGKGHEYRRLDFGANAMAGVEFKGGFFISANYDMGFMDISRTDANVKNRTLSLSVGQTINWR